MQGQECAQQIIYCDESSFGVLACATADTLPILGSSRSNVGFESRDELEKISMGPRAVTTTSGGNVPAGVLLNKQRYLCRVKSPGNDDS